MTACFWAPLPCDWPLLPLNFCLQTSLSLEFSEAFFFTDRTLLLPSPQYLLNMVPTHCYTVVQSLSRVWLCNTVNCNAPASPVLHHLPEPAQAHVHGVGDAIQRSHPLSSPSPPVLNLSQHQSLFQWVSSSHQVAKVLEIFSFSIHPSNEYLGLISFRMDWLDLLAVQGTLKSLLQHHSSKASIHQCSAFFMVLLSHLYMTTGRTSSFYSHIRDVNLSLCLACYMYTLCS